MGDVIDIKQFILVCEGQTWAIFQSLIIAVDSAGKVTFIALCETHVHMHTCEKGFFIDGNMSAIEIFDTTLIMFDGFIGEAEFSIDDSDLIINIGIEGVNFGCKVKVVQSQFAILDGKVDAAEAIDALDFELIESFDFFWMVFFIFGLKDNIDDANSKFIVID